MNRSYTVEDAREAAEREHKLRNKLQAAIYLLRRARLKMMEDKALMNAIAEFDTYHVLSGGQNEHAPKSSGPDG